MTVSGTTAFAMTVSEIVDDARDLLGISAEEEPLEAVDLNKGVRALNQMLRAWQADGVQTWVLTEGTFALVASDADYVFGTGGSFTTVPMEIMDMRITRNGTDLPMHRMGREEYFALPNKTTTGYPTCYYYDRQRNGGTLYVWPAPDATAGTLKFTYRRQIMDAGDGTDTLDIPTEWLECVTSNLAIRLAPRYEKQPSQVLAALAQSSYAALKSFDTSEGHGSISILPEDH
jgi:hypothetical protein